MVVKTVAGREDVADAEDNVVRLFRPKSCLIGRDDPVLINPLNRPACISSVVGKKGGRHVIRSQYHVGRWHRTAALSLTVAKGVTDEVQQWALGGISVRLLPRS